VLHGLTRYVRRHHAGLLALVVALGGTAYAANKIHSKDIAPNAVKAKHVKAGAIRAKQIRDGTVGAAEIGPGAVTDAAIAPGAVGGGDLRCPAGLALRAGLCFENAPRPAADWDTAIADCAQDNLRLPTVPEGYLALSGYPTPAVQMDYWSSDSTSRDAGDNQFSALIQHLGTGTPNTGYAGQFSAHPYFCVISAGA
jgi:hypothetical protein